MRVFFLSGSDTDVGKTFIASQLVVYFQSLGLKALTIKPIETGVRDFPYDGSVHLKDAQKLFPNMLIQDIVLYTFPLPASPFVADTEKRIDCEKIFSHIASFQDKLDVLIIEGAGGVFVPIKKDYFMLDFAYELQEKFNSEVIFVCDDALGMINRLLSGHSILNSHRLSHHLYINLRNEKTFQEISLPFLLKSSLIYSLELKNLVTSLKVFE
ncbi:dethiobiotin synthase [Helicobacter cholecystus]|uniref:ATP-dependent dethiobiotin synthetase BioD n=1 Tax=Helicobacter cholecystus TaxID=45498 RepID=A0A3D8IV00_9HELI|nr:dethiobiotin synthase [Helicobacter cholecystus]RDU68830.1 dethiobiotin synthase [Helicobacter cholecystus]VEJ23892.1 dethiobiotin synthetase [Helicobacter cholecystus]